MKTTPTAFLVLPLVLTGSLAGAHHSFFAVFDGAQLVTVEGKIAEFRMVNPHAMMKLDVVSEDGMQETWTVEFDGRLHLSRAGWDQSTFTVGEELAVTGNPAKSGSPMMFFHHSIDASGKELVRPRVALEESIEEQRRQRRAAAETQN